ncbi:MAG: amidase [Myxococcota bacterium]
MTERTDLPPLAEIAQRYRAGSLSPTELGEQALAAAERDPFRGYRVVRSKAFDLEVRAAAAAFAAGRDVGPLAGIPISVKDLYGVPGERTFAGTAKALPESFERAGPVVGRCLRQLAPIVGKTHTVELAFGGIGANGHWGTPLNPRSPEVHRVPGGSSSGAGTSLADGSALLALGTDTAGSVRIPAAWTGHVGVKTTKGRWSTEGIVPLSTTLDTPGILTRTVEDAVYAFASLDGPAESFAARLARVAEPSLGQLRLGFARGVFREDCDPGVLEAVAAALEQFEAGGAAVADVDLPGLGRAQAQFAQGGPVAVEVHRFLDKELPEWWEHLEPRVGQRIAPAENVSGSEYLERRQEMERAHAMAMGGFEDVDVYVTPTVANTPPLAKTMEEDLDAYRKANLRCLRNTAMVSYLGLCAVSLPCGLDSAGMPVGLQLIGPAGEEERVLGIARTLERMTRLWPRKMNRS